jgi:hypothetical protein
MPIVSNRGNHLVMVVFEVDSNYIDAEPLKDSTDGSLIQAYQKLWKRITSSGAVTPKLHILDNEVSIKFKEEIKKIAQCNWYHRTLTDAILRNAQSRHLRTTSLQSYLE